MGNAAEHEEQSILRTVAQQVHNGDAITFTEIHHLISIHSYEQVWYELRKKKARLVLSKSSKIRLATPSRLTNSASYPRKTHLWATTLCDFMGRYGSLFGAVTSWSLVVVVSLPGNRQGFQDPARSIIVHEQNFYILKRWSLIQGCWVVIFFPTVLKISPFTGQSVILYMSQMKEICGQNLFFNFWISENCTRHLQLWLWVPEGNI